MFSQGTLSPEGDEESFDDGELAGTTGGPTTEELDDCLGPDDPGVGPWVLDFFD